MKRALSVAIMMLLLGCPFACGGDSTEEGSDCEPSTFEQTCDGTERVYCKDDGTVDHWGCCISCSTGGTSCGCNINSSGNAVCFCS